MARASKKNDMLSKTLQYSDIKKSASAITYIRIAKVGVFVEIVRFEFFVIRFVHWLKYLGMKSGAEATKRAELQQHM